MLSGRRKLLLADDSPTIQKVISLTFGDEGMEVLAVGDGAGALRALEDEPPPDIVLADVVMPGPDGYELCERVKRDGRLRHVPVVLLVGTFEPFNEAEARRVGADTVLTKPFQSIRDLVSKVGSLLGGGETKDDEATHDEVRATMPASTPARRRSDTEPPVAQEPAAFEVRDESRPAEPAGSFADLGADDELIEARPADTFGAAASAGFQPRVEGAHEVERASDFAETRGAGFLSASRSEAGGDETPALFGADELVAEGFNERDAEGGADRAAGETSRAAARPAEQAEERDMREQTPPQPSFDTHAAGAAAADDALLDLGRFETPAAAPVAEADDFILDLGFEDEPQPQVFQAGADEPRVEEPLAVAPAWTDAPSAFAEAAHGEQPRQFAEAAPSFDDDLLSLDEETPSHAEPVPAQVWGEPEAQGEPWREVVVLQDGPQGFAFGSEPEGSGGPARGFIEPEVVPAEEPVPAVVEDEFTDGSVEGDLPRPPAPDASSAAGFGAQPRSLLAAHATQEPSTASYTVGEARAGLDESPRADSLSPEMVDAIARRVVELMSDRVVREIAWEVVPELAELLIKQRLEEERQ